MHHPKDVKCSPSSDKVTVKAKDVAFSTDCLAFEADKPFSIQFKNEDEGVEHNIAIFKDPDAAEKLFKGELTTGPSDVTYNVNPIPKGKYHFHCDVHPDMNGAVIVG